MLGIFVTWHDEHGCSHESPVYYVDSTRDRFLVVDEDRDFHWVYTSNCALLKETKPCRDSMLLYESVCALASERGAEEPACYFDIITEYASREMTLDEIEKELGYKE